MHSFFFVLIIVVCFAYPCLVSFLYVHRVFACYVLLSVSISLPQAERDQNDLRYLRLSIKKKTNEDRLRDYEENLTVQ